MCMHEFVKGRDIHEWTWSVKYKHCKALFTAQTLEKGPTCILEVHVVAKQCVFQPVAHDFELHDLLPDSHVWLCNVKFDFWVVDLIG